MLSRSVLARVRCHATPARFAATAAGCHAPLRRGPLQLLGASDGRLLQRNSFRVRSVGSGSLSLRRFCASTEGAPAAPKARPKPLKKAGGFGVGKAVGAILVVGGVAYAVNDDAQRLIDSYIGDVAVFFEDFNDTTMEFLESVGDRFVTKKQDEPWLMDVPDHVPTLVLDLDKVILKLQHDSRNGWHVVKRPFAEQFLKEIHFFYDVVLFSDDQFPVAEQIAVKWNLPVSAVLHREFCKKKRNHYVKDISKLGRNLSKVLIIDHDEAAFQLQPENGILIKPFDGDASDCELLDLLEFLKAASASNMDLREFVARFGGGDVDVGRRYLLHKADQDAKVQQRRSVGKYFSTSRQVSGRGVQSINAGFPR
eukprot:TRINITY_DN57036_c0_g1_i1.p1 TRINITY_DN57036_c0_g1~~TRINITY_DN57036_c0_g1_i1.p1  ORF type:complete len:367 (-),score=72.12 TRINITY_DN57036_c0_g1_i1:282-1382(-)